MKSPVLQWGRPEYDVDNKGACIQMYVCDIMPFVVILEELRCAGQGPVA